MVRLLRTFWRWCRPTPPAAAIAEAPPRSSGDASSAAVADGSRVAGFSRFDTTRISFEDSDTQVEVPFVDDPEENPRDWLLTGFLMAWSDAWARRDYFDMSRLLDQADGVMLDLIYPECGEGEVSQEGGEES